MRSPAVDFTSVDTRSSEREAATFNRMHEITSSYQKSAIYQGMLEKIEQSLQQTNKPPIPFKSKESPSGAAKLEVLLRWNLSFSNLLVIEWNHIDTRLIAVPDFVMPMLTKANNMAPHVYFSDV